MPVLTKTRNTILPANAPWTAVDMDDVHHVLVTDSLAAFVAEHRCAVIPAEAVLGADGAYDLHPDARFVPQDVPPGE